jgi:type VI protein secretion system component VasF
VRRYLRPRLIRIVSEGYDCGDKQESLHATALFAGCYVVASGREAARQAFVPKVFERLYEFEKPATSRLYLEWLPATLRADRVRRRIAHATYGASLVLLVVAVVFWFFFRGPQ